MLELVNILIYHHLPENKPTNSFVADHLILYNHSASYDNFSIVARENKKFLLEFKESLLIMRNKTSGTLHRHHCTYSAGPNNKIFVRILFVLIVATLFLLNGLFYYFVMFKCMSTTVRVNGTVRFTFFLIMRLKITIISCDLLIVIP